MQVGGDSSIIHHFYFRLYKHAGKQLRRQKPQGLRGAPRKIQEQPRGPLPTVQDDELQTHQQQGRKTDDRTGGQLPQGQQEGGRQLRRHHVLRRRQDQGISAQADLPHRQGLFRSQGVLPGHQNRQPRRPDLRQQNQGHVQLIPHAYSIHRSYETKQRDKLQKIAMRQAEHNQYNMKSDECLLPSFEAQPILSFCFSLFCIKVYCGYSACFRNKQFILMTTRDLLPSPLTPDKRPLPQNPPTQSSSANTKTSLPSDSFSASPTSHFVSQNGPLAANNHFDHLKLLWFHKKTQELRIYLHENARIDKQHIRQIFEWQHQDEQEGQSVLKDLSLKVRSLIKENHELRMISRSEEWEKMKAENEEMRAVIDQLRRGEDAREKILSEQNQYLRDYIERHKTNNQKIIHQMHDEEDQTANNAPLQITAFDISETNIGSLRKYILAYINTVIQANDEKLAAQQRYIATLEKRLSSITKFQAIVSHLQFQKAVRMQESGRKSKNFTTGAPKIQGDCVQYEPHQSPISQPTIEKPRYFKSKTCKQQPQNKEIVSLVLRSAQLQQDLTILQEKYEEQVENRIRDSSNREELLTSIQKLTAEKKELQHLVRELQQRLKKQVNCPQSLREELSEIKKDLMGCGVENLSIIQRQISELTIERNHLKKELSQLQHKIASGSKFSSTHKELFLLKDKNAQLEQNCRFYEQQIVEYQKELRKISEENQRRLAKDISRDFKEMKVQDLGWPSLAHQRITHTILRLQNIEKQLATA